MSSKQRLEDFFMAEESVPGRAAFSCPEIRQWKNHADPGY